MPTYRVTGPDGKTYRVTAPEGATETEILERVKAGAQQPKPQEQVSPLDGMGRIDRFLAGLGKSIYDTGRGLRQLGAETGNVLGLVGDETVSSMRQEADQIKAQDKALMDDGWALGGNVLGHAGMALAPGGALSAIKSAPAVAATGRAMMAAPSTIPGVAAGAAGGAIQGAAQPVGENDSRTLNTVGGAVGGAIVPTAGLAVNVGRELFRPMTAAGREVIVGRAMNRAAGQAAPAVKQRLSQASALVPGATPTVADVAESGGIAALQRGASAVDPEAYAAREVEKLNAWRAALSDIAGDSSKRAVAESVRSAATKGLYSHADFGMAPVDTFFSSLANRPAVKTAIAQAQKNAKNNGLDDIFFRDAKGNPVGLLGQGGHFIKKALDDASEAAIRAGKPEASRGVASTRDEFISWLEGHIPEYGMARQTFAQLSKPINQMDVGQKLFDALTPASVQFGRLGGMKAENFASAIANAPKTVKSATGMNASSLTDVLTPTQAGTVNNVAKDVARTLNAQGLGRGVGSNTAQNLAMANILESSGLPMGILNAPLIGPAMGALGKVAPSEAELRRLLAEAMLDPKKAALLMQAAEDAAQTAAQKSGRAISYAARPALQGLLSSQFAQ